MHLNQTSEWKAMTLWVWRKLLLFNFERLNILLAWIRHPNQKLWLFVYALCFHVLFWTYRYIMRLNRASELKVMPYELAESFVVQFQASWYIIGLNRTSESKVMAVSIFHVLPCLILSISIYYAPELDIWVKSYAIWDSWELLLFIFERLDIL